MEKGIQKLRDEAAEMSTIPQLIEDRILALPPKQRLQWAREYREVLRGQTDFVGREGDIATQDYAAISHFIEDDQ